MYKCMVCKTVSVKDKYDMCSVCEKEYEKWYFTNYGEFVGDITRDRGVTDHVNDLGRVDK